MGGGVMASTTTAAATITLWAEVKLSIPGGRQLRVVTL